jgi:hypothetical protein
MFLGSRARPVHKADNLTAMYESIAWTILNIPQPYRLLFYVYNYQNIHRG